MIRSVFIFLATFTVGAVAALLIRTGRFDVQAASVAPHASSAEYAAMVSNALVPPKAAVAEGAENGRANQPSAVADPHAGHGAATSALALGKPVNSVCAICGMDVDPKVPTAEYQGKTIGFGCRMCPPKFEADPDRYGPFYLRNEVIKK